MGRQPILDGLEDIVAYELLFRSPQSTSSADIVNASHATSSVILNVLSNFGIREILGGYRGFINVDADMLMNEALELLPPEMIGLELLEDVVITPEIIERCRVLKSQGFVLALDDHRYNPAYEELYAGVVDIVKFDLLATPLEELYRAVELMDADQGNGMTDGADFLQRCKRDRINQQQQFVGERRALSEGLLNVVNIGIRG